MGEIKEYLKLFRIQTGGLTAMAPVIGYLLSPIHHYIVNPYVHIVILFCIGLLGHIYGNILNEIFDYELDRKAGYLKHKPLVAGTIPISKARGMANAFLASALILGAIFFITTPKSYIFLILSAALVYIYNRFGKKFLGSDFILALGVGMMVIFGYETSVTTQGFSMIVVAVSALAFLQVAFNNSVEGGIKDLENDLRAGVKTMAIALGCHVQNVKKILVPPFIIYGICLKSVAIIIVLVFLPNNPYIIGIAVFLITIIIVTMVLFFYQYQNREYLKRIFSLHEISTYGLTCILLTGYIPIYIVVPIFLVPFALYIFINIVIHGSILSPGV